MNERPNQTCRLQDIINKQNTSQSSKSKAHRFYKMSEDHVRQRRGQKEKDAMKSRLEEMKRKMKDSEQRQERWNSAMETLK